MGSYQGIPLTAASSTNHVRSKCSHGPQWTVRSGVPPNLLSTRLPPGKGGTQSNVPVWWQATKPAPAFRQTLASLPMQPPLVQDKGFTPLEVITPHRKCPRYPAQLPTGSQAPYDNPRGIKARVGLIPISHSLSPLALPLGDGRPYSHRRALVVTKDDATLILLPRLYPRLGNSPPHSDVRVWYGGLDYPT